MKTFILLFLTINCLAQEKNLSTQEVYPNGLIVTSKWYNQYGVMGIDNISYPAIYFQRQKHYDYIEIKVVKCPEKIRSPYAYIKTNIGNYTANYIGKTPRGVLIFRIYLSQKDAWVGIDAGIRTIEFETVKKWHKIIINENLNNLKNYGAN